MKKILKCTSAVCAALIAMTSFGGCAKKLPDVKLSVWATSEYCDFFENAAQEFAQKYSDQVNFVITVSEEKEETCKETVMASPENAADLFVFADDQLDELIGCGALRDISSEAGYIDEYCGGAGSGAALSSERDGKYYAYPFVAGNCYFLYYNSDYFSEEDIGDLDTILDICEKNNKLFAMDFGSGWYIYSFFKGAGLDVGLDPDGVTNHCNWNSTETPITGSDVAQAMLKIAGSSGFASLNSDKLTEGAANGEVIAGVSGAWNAEKLSAAYGDGYAAAKLPTYTAAGKKLQMASFAGYKLIGINAYSENAEWAMKLAEELTSEEKQLEFFRLKGECPANVKAADTDIVRSSPAVKALSDQSKYSYTQHVGSKFWDPSYIFGSTIASQNPDSCDLQELLDTMVEGITAKE